MSSITVLGIKIDKINLEKALLKSREFLHSSGQYKIFTPNPEMAVKAQKDENFKKILNNGDLNICDGFGLSIISGAPRITGVDFMLEICQIAVEKNKGIFLLGSENNEIAKKTAEELQKKFPDLKIAGFDQGPMFSECRPHPFRAGEVPLEVINKINESGADILFVAFGMGKQEKWISEHLIQMPKIKIAMGVGGAFDYISGNIPRAPRFLRQIGLEWIYRLIQQPERFWRIFNATFRFIFLFITKKM